MQSKLANPGRAMPYRLHQFSTGGSEGILAFSRSKFVLSDHFFFPSINITALILPLPGHTMSW